MSTPNTDRVSEFRRKLRELVLEYELTIEVNTGYYEDVEGIDFCVDGKRVVEHRLWGGWNFSGEQDTTVSGSGCQTIDQLRMEPKP